MACGAALEDRVVHVLHSDRPHAYCDGCLALRVHATLEEARRAAERVAAEAASFDRRLRACHGCGRTLQLTCLR
ncbi:MAG: hypothetical protein HYU51_17975 [Candidatus Rokubacteria bacterium]|nr:hypothetical protein [Candidatus Rokubacteria bacterium]